MSNSEIPRTEARQAPLSKGFSRQEYWSGLPCPPPGDLPNPGTEPRSPALQGDSLPSEPPEKPREGQAVPQVRSSRDILCKSLDGSRILSKQPSCRQKLRPKKMTARNTSAFLQGQLCFVLLLLHCYIFPRCNEQTAFKMEKRIFHLDACRKAVSKVTPIEAA